VPGRGSGGRADKGLGQSGYGRNAPEDTPGSRPERSRSSHYPVGYTGRPSHFHQGYRGRHLELQDSGGGIRLAGWYPGVLTGTFIALSCPVLAMAPALGIGTAHPVTPAWQYGQNNGKESRQRRLRLN